ncbi:Meiotic recombination protein DMC1 homolog A-like protein [Drosera capensis]
MMRTKKSLTGIKGLSEAEVDKICEAAEKLVALCLCVSYLVKWLEYFEKNEKKVTNEEKNSLSALARFFAKITLLEKQSGEISAQCFVQIAGSECSLNFARDAYEALKYLCSNEVVHTLAKKSALKGLQEILSLEGTASGSKEPLAIGDIQFPKGERYYRLQSPSESSLMPMKYFCSNEFVAAIAGFLQCSHRYKATTSVRWIPKPTKSSREVRSSGQSTGGESMKEQEDEWTIRTSKWKPKNKKENADDPFVLIGKQSSGGTYFRVYNPNARIIWDRQRSGSPEAGYTLVAYDIEGGMLMKKSREEYVFYNYMRETTVALPRIPDIPEEAKVVGAFEMDPVGDPDSWMTVLAYLSGQPNDTKNLTVSLLRGNDWVVGRADKITDVSALDRCAKVFGRTLYLLDGMGPRVVTVEMDVQMDHSLTLDISTSPRLIGSISPRSNMTLAREDQNLYLVSMSLPRNSTERTFRFVLLRGEGAEIGSEINLSQKGLRLTNDFGGEVYDIVRDEIIVTWGGPLKSAASRENTWPLKSEYATVLRRHRRLSCTCEHQYRGLCLCEFAWVRLDK